MHSPNGYILDTNILVALIRDNELGHALDAEYGLRTSLANSMISVVTVGEMLALARKLSWGQGKITSLYEMMQELVWIDINSWDILEAYSEIDARLESRGVRIGKNDLWIAATTKVTGATLLTTDADFKRVDEGMIALQWIDPDTRGES